MSRRKAVSAGPADSSQAQGSQTYQDRSRALAGYAWWQDYCDLRERGWDWRKAVYIAWAAGPAATRRPRTQYELATKILGLTTDRVISQWAKTHPEIADEIARMQAAPLLQYRRDIYNALIAVAKDPDPKAHQDRKLALEMLGDYQPRSQANVAVTAVDAGVVIYLPDNGRDGGTGQDGEGDDGRD